MENFWNNRRTRATLLVIALLLSSARGLARGAEESASPLPGLSSEEQVQITADELVADNQERSIEFIGNVEAVQGDIVIHSNRLRIIYSDSEGQQGQGLQGGVDTLTATGDVTIHFGNRVATTEMAEYRSNEGVLVLSGKGSRVVEGENSIIGSRITLYREDDRITVEGGEKERVKAIFFPSSRSQD